MQRFARMILKKGGEISDADYAHILKGLLASPLIDEEIKELLPKPGFI
jgi:hypothetical protein